MHSLLLTLRHNIVLDTDVALAQEELGSICNIPHGALIPVIGERGLRDWLDAKVVSGGGLEHRFVLDSRHRKNTTAFVLENATPSQLVAVISRAAFIQEVVMAGGPPGVELNQWSRFIRSRQTTGGWTTRAIPIATILEYSALLVTRRDRIGSISSALDQLLAWLLDEAPLTTGLAVSLADALTAKKTTLYLTHELHLYKGKFFPRLVHGLINRYVPKGKGIICDPFAGSGTALLEASLLGFDAVGLDVDPTSVLVSQNKTSLASVDCKEIQAVTAAMHGATESSQCSLFEMDLAYSTKNWKQHRIPVPEPMRSRLKKRGMEEGYDLLGEIEREAAISLTLIAQAPPHLRALFRVCLSHALTKKLRLRFVGIGNGRFTFDVAKVSVLELFLKKGMHVVALAEVFAWLKRASPASLGKITVHRASAMNMAEYVRPGSIDLVVTSPPYIPASSGREHYARARAIPLVLTGAASLEELDDLDSAFIGEMNPDISPESIEPFPEVLQRSLLYLRNDEQRNPKYLPTLRYYSEMRTVLQQISNSLSSNGAALMVVAKSHTFYVHKTKQIVHTLEADKIMCAVGLESGLEVERVIDVPLQKSGGLNARPRSTDEYSEAVIVFRRTSRNISKKVKNTREAAVFA